MVNPQIKWWSTVGPRDIILSWYLYIYIDISCSIFNEYHKLWFIVNPHIPYIIYHITYHEKSCRNFHEISSSNSYNCEFDVSWHVSWHVSRRLHHVSRIQLLGCKTQHRSKFTGRNHPTGLRAIDDRGFHGFSLWLCQNSDIENGPVEIVDLPIDSMVDLSIVVCMFTRG